MQKLSIQPMVEKMYNDSIIICHYNTVSVSNNMLSVRVTFEYEQSQLWFSQRLAFNCKKLVTDRSFDTEKTPSFLNALNLAIDNFLAQANIPTL